MKKILSILLSLLMIFTSASFIVGAEGPLDSLEESALSSFLNGLSGGLNSTLELDDGSDVEAMLQSGALNNVDMLGLDIGFLYNSTSDLLWSTLTVTKADMALAKANINTYLSTAISNIIGDYEDTKFCTAANATKLTNYIGKLLDPDFVDVNIPNLAVEDEGFYYDSFDIVNVFYTKIARYSGLIDKIQTNWIDANINFSPVLYLLGFNFSEDMMLGKTKLSNAERIGPTLVKSVIKTVCQQGPLEYVLRVLARLSATYGTCMFEPIKAIFQAYISKGIITEDELYSIKGLLNLVVNHNNKSDSTKLQFISAPSYRFATCVKSTDVDTTQMFLYGLVYMTLVGKYGTNAQAVQTMKNKVNSTADLNAEQKSTICSIYDGVILNNLSGLVDHMSKMFDNNVDEVNNTLWNSMISFFRNFWKTISTFFSKLFDSLANFGDF